MYFRKRGEVGLVVIIVLTVLVLGGLYVFDSSSGGNLITGASIGITLEEDLALEEVRGGISGTFNLTLADTIFNGIDSNDKAGWSMSSGDVNNDGMKDVIISAYFAASFFGEIYIIYGNDSFNPEINLSDANVLITGTKSTGDAGWDVKSADFNNDSIDDILISAPLANSNWGEAYIVYGGESLATSISLSNANVTFSGAKSGMLGKALTHGDLNCDGVQDIIIGAPTASNASFISQEGEVYVVFGGSYLPSTLNLSNDNFTAIGPVTGWEISKERGLTSANFNGDNCDDLIIGTVDGNGGGGNRDGKTFVVYGSPEISGTRGLNHANFTIKGNEGLEFSGNSVDTGDVNNDGFDDILIGAYGSDANGTDIGRAYLVYGGNTTYDVILDTNSNVTINGVSDSDETGFSVSIGDYNQDNFADIIVGAPEADPNSVSGAGNSYIVFGTSETLLPVINLSSAANVTFNGIDADDKSGYYLSYEEGLGLLIGAYTADPYSASAAGEVYLVNERVSCGVISKNVTLNSNLTVSGNCFTINSSNIKINGNGYTIKGDGTGTAINLSNANNTRLYNFNVEDFSIAINLELISSHNNFSHMNINSSLSDLRILDNGGIKNELINVTFDRTNSSVGTNSDYLVKWYVTVHVNDTSNNDLVSVNVSGYNTSNELEEYQLTESDGLTQLSLIEYIHYGTGTPNRVYNTNHTINVTKNLYTKGFQGINLTASNNTQLFYTIQLGCGTITESTTFSAATFNSSGTCFTVSASNIDIDGNGLVINGKIDGAGINISGYNNVTFRNMRINNFSEGISLHSTNNSYFYNLIITNSSIYDIFAENNAGVNNTFVNVSFRKENSSIGTSSDIFVKWFVDVTTLNNAAILTSTNVTGYNVSQILENSNTTNANGVSRLILTEYKEADSGKQYYTPNNVTALKSGYQQASQTINLTPTNSTALSLNLLGNTSCQTITQSTTFARSNSTANGNCMTIATSHINIIGNGSIITGNGSGVGIYIIGANNITLDGFTFNNFSQGIYLINANNISVTALSLSNNDYGLYLDSTSSDNNFTNGIISSSSTYDVYMNSGTDNELINISMNKNSIYSGEDSTILMKWYLDIEVNDTDLSPLSSVNVSAFKADGTLEESKTTSATGTTRLIVTEFSKGEFGYTYITPHQIKTELNGYVSNSTSIAIDETNNSQNNFLLGLISCNSTITTNITLGNNLQSNGTCFKINSDDITIDGNNFNITGIGSGTGINLSGRNNLLVRNIGVINFSKGIYLESVNDSTFDNLEVRNNTYGIYFNRSYDNVVSSATFASNLLSVYTTNDGETNNTLLNVSVDLDNVTVNGTASIYLKWYVHVNVTYNGGNPLQNANATGYFNSTGLIDDSVMTGSNGIARLELTELKKNSSEVTYLTKHNVTAFFSSASGFSQNDSIINLTQTNSTEVNLNLTLNCSAPYDGMSLTANTVLCPGTYQITDSGAAGVITIGGVYNLTCDDTIIVGDGTGTCIEINSNDVTVDDCTIKDYTVGISPDDEDNVTLKNIRMDGVQSGIDINFNSDKFKLQNSEINVTSTGIMSTNGRNVSNHIIEHSTFRGGDSLHYCWHTISNYTNNIIRNNTFIGDGESTYGVCLWGHNNSVYNNTFQDHRYGVRILNVTNNYVYYNTFEDSTDYHAYVLTEGNHFNISSGNVSVGNSWDDYCGLSLTDSDGDGYADSGSEYPYNATYSDKFFGFGNDYGPLALSCPSVSALGSSGSSSSSSSSTAAIAAAEAPAPAPTKKSQSKEVDFYNSEETKEFLKTEKVTTSRTSNNNVQIAVTLENTGVKKMKLFPDLDQETEDPFFIVTRKTRGYEGSFFSRLAGISYSNDTIAGRLLEAEIIGADEITINPGESLQHTLEIKDALIPPKQIKIQFSSFGETVSEQEITIEPKTILSGSAVDIDIDNNFIDIYAIMVPENINGNEVNNEITGAISGLHFVDEDYYYLELEFIKKGKRKASFTDLYGPYILKKSKYFIFAQQFKYTNKYNGDYIIKSNILRGSETVAENKHDIHFE